MTDLLPEIVSQLPLLGFLQDDVGNIGDDLEEKVEEYENDFDKFQRPVQAGPP